MSDEPTSSYVGQAGDVNTVAMLHGTQDVYMITHHLCMVHVDCNTLLWKTIRFLYKKTGYNGKRIIHIGPYM